MKYLISMPSLFSRLRLVLIVVCAGACLCQAAAPDADKPRLSVSVFPLGITGGSLTSAEMAAALNEGTWCQAVETPAARWNQRPEGLPAGAWLSIVLAGFGDQAQAFAFLFDSPGAPPRLAAHVPYPISWVYRSKVWIVPTDRIAAAIREFYRNTQTPPVQPVLALTVTERAEAEIRNAPAGTLQLENLAPVKRASSVTKREALPPLEAMIAGAMLENGLTPSWAAADQSLQAEIQFGFQASSVRLTRQGAVKTVSTKDNIPEEQYYGHLARLFFGMAAPGGAGISDFVQLEKNGPCHLLVATSNRLCVASARALTAFDPRTGRQVYPDPEEKQEPRQAPGYTVRSFDADQPRLFRVTQALADVQPTTGAETPLAPQAPSTPWSFAVAPDGLTVLASGNTLGAYRDGKPVWSESEPAALSAGPAVQGERVFAGAADGRLLARARADGRELWKKDDPRSSWSGGIGTGAGCILVYDKNGDNLTAFNPADGALLWKQPVGDVLLKTPFAVGGRLLVVGKNNRLLLLDEADGKIVAEVRWPTWLVDVIPVRGSAPLVACTDIHGTFSLLDGATLKTVRTLRLPARPSGPLLALSRFPTLWGVDSDEDEEMGSFSINELKPAVLVGDAEGFCSIVPLP